MITGVGDGVFCVDGEHPAGGELLISSAIGGGEAPKDSGNHFIMILEGIVVVPSGRRPLASSLLSSSSLLA